MGKIPLAHAGKGSDPWVGKIRWRRAWRPTPVFLPGESHGERSLAGHSPRGCHESDATEATEHTAPTKQNQAHTHAEQTRGCQQRGRHGGGEYWACGIIQRMEKQQGPTVYHRELYSGPVINQNGKNLEKYIYIN